MIITHYTKPIHIRNILSSGELKLEGCNFDEDQLKTYVKLRAGIRLLWFTESKNCNTAKPIYTDQFGNFIEFVPNLNQIGFQFDSEEIKAIRWEEWCRPRKIFEKKKLAINILNTKAININDDPRDFWVLESPISLNYCKSYVVCDPKGQVKKIKLEEILSYYRLP
jgi:hypothetical protein